MNGRLWIVDAGHRLTKLHTRKHESHLRFVFIPNTSSRQQQQQQQVSRLLSSSMWGLCDSDTRCAWGYLCLTLYGWKVLCKSLRNLCWRRKHTRKICILCLQLRHQRSLMLAYGRRCVINSIWHHTTRCDSTPQYPACDEILSHDCLCLFDLKWVIEFTISSQKENESALCTHTQVVAVDNCVEFDSIWTLKTSMMKLSSHSSAHLYFRITTHSSDLSLQVFHDRNVITFAENIEAIRHATLEGSPYWCRCPLFNHTSPHSSILFFLITV